MRTQDIILLDGFRFFNDMFRRIIAKTPGLRVVADESNPENFAKVLAEMETDWVIFLRRHDEDVPKSVNDFIQRDISKHLMVIETNGSKVKMKWYEPHEVELKRKNLDEILEILIENHPKYDGGS